MTEHEWNSVSDEERREYLKHDPIVNLAFVTLLAVGGGLFWALLVLLWKRYSV
jgi:hypothetical protein